MLQNTIRNGLAYYNILCIRLLKLPSQWSVLVLLVYYIISLIHPVIHVELIGNGGWYGEHKVQGRGYSRVVVYILYCLYPRDILQKTLQI